MHKTLKTLGAPLKYFNVGGVRVHFFGSEILAKSDFFRYMKGAKKTENFFEAQNHGNNMLSRLIYC